MTVVGLHPEDLFDKLLDGDITSSERERLRLHLQACDVCRFEYAARGDFLAEASSLEAPGVPALLPLRTPLPTEALARVSLPPRRRRSRLAVWGLAVAGLISASGAVAAVVAGNPAWHSISQIFSRAATPAARPAPVAKSALHAAPGCKGADCVAVSTAARQPKSTLALSPVPISAPQQIEPTQVPLAPSRSGTSSHHAVRARSAVATRHVAVSAESVAVVAATKEPTAKEPPTSARLFAEANQARRSGDVGRASGLYHLLQDQFPGSPEAELSRVTLSLLLLDSGDAQGALAGFERYLAGASQGLEAEALVGRARALGRLGRRDLESSAWQEVRRKYPRSIYGRQATDRLSALGLP